MSHVRGLPDLREHRHDDERGKLGNGHGRSELDLLNRHVKPVVFELLNNAVELDRPNNDGEQPIPGKSINYIK